MSTAKTILSITAGAILLLLISACAPSAATAPAPTQTPSPAVFQTPIGPLEHTWTRLVQGVNNTIAPPGSMVLLIGLRRPDGASIDLQQFHDSGMQVFAQAEGGEKILSTMGGFVGPQHEEFAIGFLVPEGVRPYTITWGDNPPVVVTPD